MPRGDRQLEHVLRRMGFGATRAELDAYANRPLLSVIDELLNYEQFPDDVDANIGKPEYVAVTTRGQFAPNTVVNDARQRELFRMVHSRRPLQEKMALFWHNHFATAYSKINGTFGAVHATKLMAGRQGEVTGNQRGQYELFRQKGDGKLRGSAVRSGQGSGDARVARRPHQHATTSAGELRPRDHGALHDGRRQLRRGRRAGRPPACSPDGRCSSRAIARHRSRRTTSSCTTPNNHDPTAKAFTFAIYPDGGKTIPARAAAQGMQDGLDLILRARPSPGDRASSREPAVPVFHQRNGRRAGHRDQRSGERLHAEQLQHQGGVAPVVHRRVLSRRRVRSATRGRSSSSVRSIKETGFTGLSVDAAMTPLVNMGQQLYEPPDVNGWALGAEWFSTASMLSRMNFAATLMGNQKFNIGRELQTYRRLGGSGAQLHAEPLQLRADHAGRLQRAARVRARRRARGPAATRSSTTRAPDWRG